MSKLEFCPTQPVLVLLTHVCKVDLEIFYLESLAELKIGLSNLQFTFKKEHVITHAKRGS